MPLSELLKSLKAIPQANYPSHSRIHPLRTLSFPSAQCYVKRDDELGFGVSGSKIRKYRSLLPYLKENTFEEVVLIGSAYSNHVLSFVQLLIENGIKPTLFLRGDRNRSLQGNALLISLFVPPSEIYWISRTDWKEVEAKAHLYAKNRPHPTFVLPEGGFTPYAMAGALSLPLDFLANEKESQIKFDHIFIEAGTGFMAATLLLGLRWVHHSAHVHIVLLAEDEEAFLRRLKQCHTMFSELIGKETPSPFQFSLHRPLLSQGFGQISSCLFREITTLARQEGFLTDPIYSAKLFIEGRRIIEAMQLKGNLLLIHSGGALTLTGFQHHLGKSGV